MPSVSSWENPARPSGVFGRYGDEIVVGSVVVVVVVAAVQPELAQVAPEQRVDGEQRQDGEPDALGQRSSSHSPAAQAQAMNAACIGSRAHSSALGDVARSPRR